MSLARAIACLGCVTAAPAPASTAFFANGDRLPATLTAIDAATARLDSPSLAAPAAVHLAMLLELRGEAATPAAGASHEAVVTLTNGNVLRGQLGALSDQTIVLDTWFAGRLTLHRPMIDSLRVVDRTRSIFAGPRGADGWTLSGQGAPPPWTFDGGLMTSTRPGSAARDLKLPDRIAITFDLAWRGNLRFRLGAFTDEFDNPTPPNAYLLDFNRRYVSFVKHWGGGNAMHRSTIGNAAVSQLGDHEKVHVEFMADRSAGNFVLKIDGEQVGNWHDPDADGALKGGGLHFIADETDDARPIRLSRILVEAWDGRIEEAGNRRDPGTDAEIPADSQRIRLRNGDVVTGRVLGIEDQRLVIETRHGKIRLPVSRMNTVDLHRDNDKQDWNLYQRPKLMNGDVRAWFPEGGCIVFRLDAIDGSHLVGFNQAFGTARFRRDAFHRLEFNIYKDELEPLRPSAGGW